MFNFLKKRKLKDLPNTTSIAFGLPQVQQVRQLLATRNYAAIQSLYESLKNDERSLLVEGVAHHEDTIEQVLAWHRQEEESWLANLFAGVAYTFIAWRERTAQYAEYLTDEQIEGFSDNILAAKRLLTIASRMQPDEAEIYARLIRVNMGVSEKEEAEECFETLVSLDPNHLMGHMNMVRLLAPKWLGSMEEMRDFAYQFQHPQKDDLRYTVYLIFLVENFLALVDQDVYTAEKIFKKAYKKTVKTTYTQFDVPNIPSLERYHLHNYFSYVLYLLDENKSRDQEIDLVGEHLTYIPWAYAEVFGQKNLKMIKYS
ncbi:MAG: hypothetical protein AB8G22_17825 [Saprospiraceae bacterium]